MAVADDTRHEPEDDVRRDGEREDQPGGRRAAAPVEDQPGQRDPGDARADDVERLGAEEQAPVPVAQQGVRAQGRYPGCALIAQIAIAIRMICAAPIQMMRLA